MADLHALLAAAEQDLERDAPGVPADTDLVRRVAGHVRGRRTARLAVVAAVVVVVALVAATVVAWARPTRVVPAVTPRPSVTSSAGPSVTAGTAPAGPVTDVPGIGALPQATAQTLAAAGSGWALLWVDVATAADGPPTDAVLLADDAGGLYVLPMQDHAVSLAWGTWTAGATTVHVAYTETGAGDTWGTWDLLAGTVTQDADVALVDLAGAPDPQVTRFAALDDGTGATPTGSLGSSYRVGDLATGAMTTRSWGDGRQCTAPTWSADGTTLVTTCGLTATGGVVTDQDTPTRLVVDASDGAVVSATPLAAGDLWSVGSGRPVGSGRIVVGWPVPTRGGLSAAPADFRCGDRVSLASAATATEVTPDALAGSTAVDVLAGAGDIAYLWGHRGCAGSTDVGTVVRDDLATGRATTLLGRAGVAGAVWGVLVAR